MKNHAKNKFFAVLIILCTSVTTLAGDVPIDRDFLTLKDGRWIWLEKTGWEKTTVLLGKGKKSHDNIIWSKAFESDDQRSWAYAYFVYLKPKKLAVDIDSDGKIEIGISTYDMGLLMIRDVLIFQVDKDQLSFLKEYGPYNIAADEPVFR